MDEIKTAIDTMCRRCIIRENCGGTGCNPKIILQDAETRQNALFGTIINALTVTGSKTKYEIEYNGAVNAIQLIAEHILMPEQFEELKTWFEANEKHIKQVVKTDSKLPASYKQVKTDQINMFELLELQTDDLQNYQFEDETKTIDEIAAYINKVTGAAFIKAEEYKDKKFIDGKETYIFRLRNKTDIVINLLRFTETKKQFLSLSVMQKDSGYSIPATKMKNVIKVVKSEMWAAAKIGG